MWLKHQEFREVVRGVWEGAVSNGKRLTGCLKACAEGLGGWHRRNFGKAKERISSLKDEIAKVRELERTQDIIEKETSLCADLDEWLLREELFWKQRSRVDWLKEGDRNTRFFHLHASRRREINTIESLKVDGDTWISGDEELCEVVVNHFGRLFRTSRAIPTGQMMDMLGVVPNKIDDKMRQQLTTPFTEIEVQDAVFQMFPTKAPGLDGFSALFYQKIWAIVKEMVTSITTRMLNGETLEHDINKTLITLIPKKKDPEKIEDYRLISLCNVAVKIVTKVLANRLKAVLPFIISDSQTAFVPGKLISDNILAAHELIHFIRTRGK
ncbi:hypothetical protein QQ045_019808 [Rhodiola kirilowii]